MAISRVTFTILAVAILASLLFAGLNHPIQDNNEGLYASVARDMLERGSWVIPHLDGVPYIEKPPLLYWITALSYGIFGETEAATRVAPLLGSMLMLAAVGWAARRHGGRSMAIASVFILASFPLVLGLERMLMFDMLFTGFYAWALVLLHEGLSAPEPRKWMRGAYLALSLAVLTKGWVALALFGLVAATMIAMGGRSGWRDRFNRVADPWGTLLFFAIALPWHLAAWREQPGFGWFYLWNEHVLRFLDQREPRDYYHGPAWYYLPRLAAAALPWTIVFFLPARASVRERTGFLRGFLWTCVLVPLAFFSASAAKANYYMIVGLPPLALIAAQRLVRLRTQRMLMFVPLAWIGIMATAWAMRGRLGLGGDFAIAPLAIAVCIAIVSAAYFASHRLLPGVIACAAMALPLAWFASAWLSAHDEATSARSLVQAAQALGVRDMYLYRDLESISSIAWYWQGPLRIIDSDSNELRFGLALPHDGTLFPSLRSVAESRDATPIAIVATERRRREIESSALAPGLSGVERFGKCFLYTWRPPRPAVRTVAR